MPLDSLQVRHCNVWFNSRYNYYVLSSNHLLSYAFFFSYSFLELEMGLVIQTIRLNLCCHLKTNSETSGSINQQNGQDSLE